jgi:hypothetical protein
MVEKIYDTLRAILWSQFPRNQQGYPEIYDRIIQEWFFGDRQVLPAPLGVVLRNTNIDVKDIGFGLRELEYSINIMFYSSSDDVETSERVIQEAARLAHQILKNHRTMWVCDLCPFCGKLPLSPIHYIDNGTITAVGINTATLPANTSSYNVSVPGSNIGLAGTALIKLSPSISGQITNYSILSSGIGILATSFINGNADLSFTRSEGSGHVGYSTTLMYNYAGIVLSNVNSFWQETHASSVPPYYDWAGVAYQAVQMFISDWAAGIQPAGITTNTSWNTNLNNVVNNDVQLVRLLQDIQVGSIKPSDDGMDKALLHTAEFTMKAKEIVSVDQFGPNNVDVNAV